jgi:hypothetical protein
MRLPPIAPPASVLSCLATNVHHGLANSEVFQLKQRNCINKHARAADQDPDFSRLIRANLSHID